MYVTIMFDSWSLNRMLFRFCQFYLVCSVPKSPMCNELFLKEHVQICIFVSGSSFLLDMALEVCNPEIVTFYLLCKNTFN